MKVTIITDIPSPYQIELFNSLSEHLQLSAIFIKPLSNKRPWDSLPIIAQNIILTQKYAEKTAMKWCTDSDLVIFNWYRDARVLKWMRSREDRKKPWVFWGERPGIRLPRPFGSWFRKFKLHVLHRSRAPIWGIGTWAVQEYRKEFGSSHDYENIPYFSDLKRFARTSIRSTNGSKTRIYLYSGKLNKRKGVDLILEAAAAILPKRHGMRLILAGDGPLRPQAEALSAKFPGRVDMLGFVPWDRLPDVYARADVLLAPSRYDGWNLSVPEGLAAGLPVISTDRTGAALDLIRHGENGWILRAGSAREVSEMISLVYDMDFLIQYKTSALDSVKEITLQEGVSRFMIACQRALKQII